MVAQIGLAATAIVMFSWLQALYLKSIVFIWNRILSLYHSKQVQTSLAIMTIVMFCWFLAPLKSMVFIWYFE